MKRDHNNAPMPHLSPPPLTSPLLTSRAPQARSELSFPPTPPSHPEQERPSSPAGGSTPPRHISRSAPVPCGFKPQCRGFKPQCRVASSPSAGWLQAPVSCGFKPQCRVASSPCRVASSPSVVWLQAPVSCGFKPQCRVASSPSASKDPTQAQLAFSPSAVSRRVGSRSVR